MKLSDFFKENPKVALAFSGGVDSTYLLYVAKQYAEDVTAYYVKSDFQPQFELDDAKSIAKQLDVNIKIIALDHFANPDVINNDSERCYYCKLKIFSTILDQAEVDGYPVLLDGTNASDDSAERPGMRVLTELKIKSPLCECSLTKSDIRKFSAKAGLPTANKPAYSCLATRIPHGMKITKEKLQATEKAENYLFKLGFTDFRIRHLGDYAQIQLAANDFALFFELRERIFTELNKYYPKIFLDLKPRN